MPLRMLGARRREVAERHERIVAIGKAARKAARKAKKDAKRAIEERHRAEYLAVCPDRTWKSVWHPEERAFGPPPGASMSVLANWIPPIMREWRTPAEQRTEWLAELAAMSPEEIAERRAKFAANTVADPEYLRMLEEILAEQPDDEAALDRQP